MTYAKAVDQNQKQIVAHLRMRGATVECLHAIGGGVPDLLVGWCGDNILIEVKMPKGKLNPMQCSWHGTWEGLAHVVHDVHEVDEVLQLYG